MAAVAAAAAGSEHAAPVLDRDGAQEGRNSKGLGELCLELMGDVRRVAAARGLELGDQLLGDVRPRVAVEVTVTATTAAIGDQRSRHRYGRRAGPVPSSR